MNEIEEKKLERGRKKAQEEETKSERLGNLPLKSNE